MDIWRDKIISYIKKNHVSTTEITDCMNKSGLINNMRPLNPGIFKVGKIKWVYGYNESNYTVHEQIQDVSENDIVFIETFNCGERAIVGELVSKYLLVYMQASAIISNSPFRDAANLIKEKYAIWCNGVTPIGCFNKKNDIEFDTNIIATHRELYDGAVAVCDDSGVALIEKEHLNEDFYNKLIFIENQEDTWFDCLDRLKWNTFEIVCQKKYLKSGENK